MAEHRLVVPGTRVRFPLAAPVKILSCPYGEMDITLGFGPSVPGSSPGKGTSHFSKGLKISLTGGKSFWQVSFFLLISSMTCLNFSSWKLISCL